MFNFPKYLISSLVSFVFIFFFEAFFHGNLLKGIYMATAEIWRSPEEMAQYFPFAIGSQLIIAMLVSFIYTQGLKNGGLAEGLRFGLLIGFFMGVMMFGSYPYSPIPLSLALAWLAGSIVEGLGLGLLLSFSYKKD